MAYIRRLPRGRKNRRPSGKTAQKPRSTPRPFSVEVVVQSLPHVKTYCKTDKNNRGKFVEEVTLYGLLSAGQRKVGYRLRFARQNLLSLAKELQPGDKLLVEGTFRSIRSSQHIHQDLRVLSFTKIKETSDNENCVMRTNTKGLNISFGGFLVEVA